MNFVICGLARSGTTILARFVAGLPGVRVLHEPFQCRQYYKTDIALPTEHLHGIKEPFYGLDGISQVRNDGLLKGLMDSGWRFVWLWRNPEHVYRSQSLYHDLHDRERFDQNLAAFNAFRGTQQAIDYDRFVEDPVREWNSVNPIGVLATSVFLAPCAFGPWLGCKRAREAETIHRRDN